MDDNNFKENLTYSNKETKLGPFDSTEHELCFEQIFAQINQL